MRFTRWQAHAPAARAMLATLAAGAVLATASPAAAQDSDARLKKIESQIKALQRKVFPGPDGTYFEPEVTPSTAAAAPQPVGTPSTSALTDVLARLDSIEAQLNRLTARSEVNENAISMLQDRLDALEAKATPVAPTLPAIEQPTGAIPVPDDDTPAAAAEKTSARAAPPPAVAKPAVKAPAKPSAERVAKVQAVVKPDTGDAGDDEYTYGFRLWDAGLFPETEQQLKLYVDKYPDDAKISYGRNLLGRAYLDDKQPAAAATYFLKNYQADPNGARAPDSLLFLAEAMLALKDNTKACRALAEFGDKYPALAVGRLQDQYGRDRKQAGCK